MGGPDMAPHTPQRSERRGEAVALLDAARGFRGYRGLDTIPIPPQRSDRRGEAVAVLDNPMRRTREPTRT